MATTASPRATPPARRTNSLTSPPVNSITKGATARSAVSPKVNATLNGANRRPISRGSSAGVRDPAATTDDLGHREALVAALKSETEEKEELLVRLQNKEQTITNLTAENDNLNSSLTTAESRLVDLYAEQSRMEDEMSARLELVDRLRAQVQELEREKRDVLRRYNEQTTTFDAERQSFYDNERHLKSRIQSLVQSRKAISRPHSPQENQEGEPETSEPDDQDNQNIEDVVGSERSPIPEPPQQPQQTQHDEDNEPAELTSLRLELSTLSTSYSSLQTTVQHLSAQLLDLKRVNNELQEENESYNILLREKTLSGQFDILRTVGTEDSGDEDGESDGTSVISVERSILDPVQEVPEYMDPEHIGQDHLRALDDTDSPSLPDRSRRHARSRRTGTASPSSRHSPAPRGESLADLPITGPGLDLAAELGRAENLAILEGRADPTETRDRSVLNGKVKRGKKASMDGKTSDAPRKSDVIVGSGDIDALRSEVKSLKDANKALSLYASKIIDRIIAQEGFEHVLAVDYDAEPGSPAKPKSPAKPQRMEESPKKKPRPQSAIFARTTPNIESIDKPTSDAPSPSPPESTSTTKVQRRSMSFDWKSFSMFGSTEKKPESNPSLRPLTLRPGTTTVVGARKLETHEDDDDKKERERMNATLKLMGIEKPESPITPIPIIKSYSTPGTSATEPSSPRPSRFSFFRSRSSTSDIASTHSANSATNNGSNLNLTAEALQLSEAESSLAALDAREQFLRDEIAKGSRGGFTELPQRRGLGEDWRSRRSKRSAGSGSGSTVWSAGMSAHNED